jgi:hypothetical protein
MIFPVFLCILLLVLPQGYVHSAKRSCKDKYPQCIEHLDDCIAAPGWMTMNCPKACNFCHLRDAKVRCNPKFLNTSTIPIVKSGDFDIWFKRIVDDFGFATLSRDPWIVEKDNFFSDNQVDQLLAVPTIQWEQSHESGEIDALGEGTKVISSARTSSTYWCVHDCQKADITNTIVSMIQEVLHISPIHYEPIQLLKYEKGQKYITHHDYSFDELQLACGPRILTAFLYLSDVEEGGETNFPSQKISIIPKKGKVVIWPNTLNDKPLLQDQRMFHEAKAVVSGMKYAANIWVHALEWERPSLWACTGATNT